ncbi:GNAT family N-acetyltransferase [Halocynthiibacter namhaensis]|uniref:GNAT family N-acetyltransferase n=1 Tax=Halocynthiibacter namhaensis TaxID=1290553 RepID=UPI000579253C|nr:N-acetyltransferase [Halocynthiibacter namhaensis]
MIIRPEQPADRDAINAVTIAAFATVPYGSEHDGKITDLLREAGALRLSLVAEDAGEILGHVAFSPVGVGTCTEGWVCLGPVSVRPDRHGAGIGSKLIREGLEQVKSLWEAGCILMGNPAYYSRFGFEVSSDLKLNGEGSPYLQALAFGPNAPQGDVRFHAAFEE